MPPEPDWLNGLGGNGYVENVQDEINRLYGETKDTNPDDVTDADRERIMALAERDAGKYAPTTVRNRLSYLRTTAQRGNIPLIEHNLDSLTTLLSSFRNGSHPSVKDGGINVRNYQKSLRVFYRFHDDLGISDPMEIELDDEEGRDLSPDDLLFQDDVDQLLTHTHNLRDRAFLTLALATGMRLDAIRTLRIKHVEVDGRTMDVRLNESEGALKGASGKKPLLWAKHYFREWYESHPYQDDPDSAVFCPLPDARGLNDPGAEEREPMHKESWRGMLNRMANRAGLEKDIYPHLLRHTCITRMVLEGLSEQKIKRTVDWDPDSSQFGTYVSLADQLTNDSIREDLGLPTSEQGMPVIGRPSLERCPGCNDQLPSRSERCPTCQTALTHREAEESDEPEPTGTKSDNDVYDRAVETLMDSENMDRWEAEETMAKYMAEQAADMFGE